MIGVKYNETDSIPMGFYLSSEIPQIHKLKDKTIVVYDSIGNAAVDLAISRGYFKQPSFCKYIAGKPGDTIEVNYGYITINGRHTKVKMKTNDFANRPLPYPDYPLVLKADEFFILGDHPESYDSRYYGLVKYSDLSALYTPLFTFRRSMIKW